MHILFLTDNYPPETNAPANRTHEHAKEWVASGHRVTVITCAPNFPKGRVFPGYRNKVWQREDIDGVTVVRTWTYIAQNAGFLKRILDFLSFMVTGFLAALFVRRVDVVVGTSPQFFTAVAAWAASALKRRPFVFELRDIWPESIRAVGAYKGNRLLNWLEKLELFLYRRAARVVCVTHAFRDNLIRRGIRADKIAVILNGVDVTRFAPQPKDHKLARALGLSEAFVVGYIGTHGMAHALETCLESAAKLQSSQDCENVRFLFVGQGAEKARLVRQARAMGLRNVTFVDNVPRDEIARYWSLLDASLIHLRKAELFKTVIPSKLFECMAMGVPVLHGVEGESAEIVQSHDVGMLFAPQDSRALAARIRALVHIPSLMSKFKRNGPSAATLYDRRIHAAHMRYCLESLQTHPPKERSRKIVRSVE